MYYLSNKYYLYSKQKSQRCYYVQNEDAQAALWGLIINYKFLDIIVFNYKFGTDSGHFLVLYYIYVYCIYVLYTYIMNMCFIQRKRQWGCNIGIGNGTYVLFYTYEYCHIQHKYLSVGSKYCYKMRPSMMLY